MSNQPISETRALRIIIEELKQKNDALESQNELLTNNLKTIGNHALQLPKSNRHSKVILELIRI